MAQCFEYFMGDERTKAQCRSSDSIPSVGRVVDVIFFALIDGNGLGKWWENTDENTNQPFVNVGHKLSKSRVPELSKGFLEDDCSFWIVVAVLC